MAERVDYNFSRRARLRWLRETGGRNAVRGRERVQRGEPTDGEGVWIDGV